MDGKIYDKNEVELVGTINNDFKYKNTKAGREFATFTLSIDPLKADRETFGEDEKPLYVGVRIMVFNPRLVEYLHTEKAKGGKRVSISARLNSHKAERDGVEYIQNDVVVREIKIIKSTRK